MQAQFDNIPESTLTSDEWIDVVLKKMDLMICEREGDDLRRSGRRALYEASREPKETLTQYVARREA
eukprot:1524057-Pyramimonas_sp.AAC.1